MLRIVITFLLLAVLTIELYSQPVQLVRGRVTTYSTGEPIPFAALQVRNENFSSGFICDSLGTFEVSRVPVGRYNIEISCLGFESTIVREVLIRSGKETFLEVRLKQVTRQLNDIVVKPGSDKSQPANPFVTVSSRSLSVEETQRFAGGFDDPARLVSAFAGVSGNIGNNAVIVRGNNPQSLQWKMEGIEIPAPNHVGDIRTFGGGTVTALSAQLLGKSDFLSGAMPAEYSNALSGVLDMGIRSGNNKKHEHTFQLGVVGIDLASEGPLKKGGQSSYIFNYRYSTLALVAPLLAENAGGIKYQDVAFKFNLPTKKAGTFSIWGMGLLDRLGADAKTNVTDWQYDDDRENHRIHQHMGVAGVSHRISLNGRSSLKTTLAITSNGIDYPIEQLDSTGEVRPKNSLTTRYANLSLSSSLYTQFRAGYSSKTGVTITSLNYRLHLQDGLSAGQPLQDIAKETGTSTLISAYYQSAYQLSNSVQVNAGITGQYFGLTGNYSIEPRMGITYQLTSRQSLALAYGLHSRLERLNYYFVKNKDGEAGNKSLEFTKSHHLVLGYNVATSEFSHLKAEVYYQYLFDVPVVPDSSFSMLNLQNEWFLNASLESTGKGKNYGLDVTFEKYLNRGYYCLVTGSLFHSQYRGGDLVWRNTRYDRRFALNFLFGKEWFAGKNRQNVVGVNARLNYQGGDRHSPVNPVASSVRKSVVFDESNAFSQHYPAALTTHLTVSYTLNKKNLTHQFALKIINLTQYREYVGFRYNYQTGFVDVNREPVVIPNLSYRIDF